MVRIYTDGSCIGNPGPGGYATIILNGDKQTELVGSDKHTTNNRMELQAVIEGLKTTSLTDEIEVYSDSLYIIAGMTKYLPGWVKKGWRNSQNIILPNVDLWKQLYQLSLSKKIKWTWVRAHTDKLQDECHHLAYRTVMEVCNGER